MEDDNLQRPYSVCTRDDLKDKMNKQISDISEILCLSNSDATVILMKLRWNSELLQERLIDDENKLLMESGLSTPVVVVTDSNCQDLLSDHSSCDEFYESFADVDGDDDNDDDDVKISTPFCSHKFSAGYWSEYLNSNFFSVEKTLEETISCPHQDCVASVGRDTIEKLTVTDENMYDEYVLRSYLERNKRQIIKQCPAPGCGYFIEFHGEIDDAEDEYGLNVVCLCGHTFCGRCSLESHIPVTCNNASDWLSRDLSMAQDRWKACEVSMLEAKSKLEAFEDSNNMKEEEYVKVMREGLMLIVQCRQFLKWSCVYEHLYLEYEPSKKVFMRFVQDHASTIVQRYAESLSGQQQLVCSRRNVSAVTSSIGNYFYNFSKALRDGLDVVKGKHYDDFSPCWLCDRCTYANTWIHKACQMCYDDESPVGEAE